jgi:aminopeptidase N
MDSGPQSIQRADYSPPAYLIDTVDLRFELDPQLTRVRSRLHLRRNPDTGSPERIVLQGAGLTLHEVSIDGTALEQHEYQCVGEELHILRAPPDCVVETLTSHSPAANTRLEGLYVSSGNFCTQCEPQGFRRITYYVDRPDVLARFTTTIVADREAYPVLLSNGNPVAEGSDDAGRHWVTWEDPYPKPSYLFALVAGNLACVQDQFTTASGRDVTLRIYVQSHNADKCAHAMQALKKAMQWDEAVYGLEYDLDIYMIVAVDDFNMGAMENKGLNVFNSKYVLADPVTATDDDFQAVEGVIAHEYFHNWTGNRVTLRDWFQLSLKEGLTVFRDQEFSADVSARAIKRIEDVRLLRQRQFAEDAGPMAHPIRPDSYVEINNFYTLTVYEKGAEVIRMLHTLLGESDYQRGMALYFERFDGRAVTCDDFVQAMEDASGYDLQRFRRWYAQAGTPRVSASADYTDGKYRLTLRQHTPPTPGQQDKQPLHIPVRTALLGSSTGDPLPLQLRGDNRATGDELVLELCGAEQTFEFEGLPEAPVASLLRGFSAPVKLDAGHSDAELAFLMAHDTDSFNRWDAAQDLALRVIVQLLEGQDTSAAQPFLDAVGDILRSDLDPGLRAETLRLPSEDYIGETLETIDVDGVHAARETLLRLMSERWVTEWRALYTSFHERGGYSVEPDAIGRRRLKNLALDYLCRGDGESLSLATAQFEEAGNMTDEFSALRVLVEAGSGVREQPLAAFYAKWHGNPLVVDKWFTIQALSREPDTLEQVKRLRRHEAFDLRNPNRVRALLGAFSAGNPVRFHAAEGSGYVLLADTVLELDERNPQIAARLASAFTRWRRYDEQRRELMRSQLQRIADRPALSRDVNEIVSRSLSTPNTLKEE